MEAYPLALKKEMYHYDFFSTSHDTSHTVMHVLGIITLLFFLLVT